MKRHWLLLFFTVIFLLTEKVSVFAKQENVEDKFISYVADPKKQALNFYWKDDKKINFGSIQRLKTWLSKKQQQLLFAMNGGMYQPDRSPVGLFIENKVILSPLDTTIGTGNFYLKPNGVFYITKDNVPAICNSLSFVNSGNIKYATQSGPMLISAGKIHPAFQKGSANVNIRNGVGILPDNKIIFAMSKKEVSFYDFASYFQTLGCKNALYLDGFVSRTYLPEKNWIQTDGNFGVIIGVIENAK